MKKKIPNRFVTYLFLLACLSCITIGWTSAKYVTGLSEYTSSANTANFSYEITNEVYHVEGELATKLPNSLVPFFPSYSLNQYEINTSDESNPESILVEFSITLQTDVAMRITLSTGDIPERALAIESVELLDKASGITIVGNPTNQLMFSYDIAPFKGQRIYKCLVNITHDGQADYVGEEYQADKYINLLPKISQIE